MAGAEPKKLLIVDDEEDLVFVVGLAAEATGRLTVEKAYDGEEGLSKALGEKLDIALVDAIMPKVDGFELCRRLRADRRTRDIPIVIVSAGEPDLSQANALDAGADRFVGKPFDEAALIRLLLSLSSGQPVSRRSRSPSPGARPR